MGEGRQYNQDDDEEKTSKIKKIKTTITQEEESENNNNNNNEVPTPQSGDKPLSEREPEEDSATTDEDRYKAASG